MKLKMLSALVAGTVLVTPLLAAADCFGEARPWMLRLGAHNIDPAGGASHTAAGDIEAKSKVGPTFNVDYRLCHNFNLDLLAALPYTQDLKLNGQEAGSTRHLPPTLTVQYPPVPDADFDPYVGIGVNRTFFFNESLSNGPELELSNTWGFAAQGGLDWKLTPQWLVGADLRYIQIEPEASVNGAPIGRVKINPLAYGISIGYRF